VKIEAASRLQDEQPSSHFFDSLPDVIVRRYYSLLLKLVIGGFLFCSSHPVSGEFLTEALSGRIEARGVAAPFYDGAQLNPSLILRVDSVYTDYERKGFFRIGILPLAVMEGVKIEVYQPESLARGLEQMNNWLGVRAARRVEFRKLSFVVFTGETNCLICSRAQAVGGGKWELLGGVHFRAGTNEVSAASAILQVNGPQTGRIVLGTNPPRTNSLFNQRQPTNQPADHP
jgi:hypothetical protein